MPAADDQCTDPRCTSPTPVPANGRGGHGRDGLITISALLSASLGSHDRLRELELLCSDFAARPLDTTVSDLRGVLSAAPISGEDYRRLHILISTLYHQCGADVPLTRTLRAEVGAARDRRITAAKHPGEEEGHVVSH